VAEPTLDAGLRELVSRAEQVRGNAHARYSGFQVGAALRAAGGRIHVGCNVENASYGATMCAERGAVAAMVAAGNGAIEAVAVFTRADPPSMPCGICRQVLLELGSAETIVVAASPEAVVLTTLGELLPLPFAFVR
jgi:cytidine deaminase